jgi:hypothetical protein
VIESVLVIYLVNKNAVCVLSSSESLLGLGRSYAQRSKHPED